VLGSIGDLVEDVVVHFGGPVRLASDTTARITRRRGGSAANVCVAAARLTGAARFLGQVGADRTGDGLLDDLAAEGVEATVHRGGRTGTIVVLVDDRGERTMLSDRGASTELTTADPAWLDGLHTLHVPVYSLVVEPLASAAISLVADARRRGIRISVDASSVGVIEAFGAGALVDRLAALHPDVLLANDDEASCLGQAGLSRVGAAVTVVKRGAAPASVRCAGAAPVDVPARPLGPVPDTTGAGDAFAAGMLVALAAGADPVEAARVGHDTAARTLASWET
jgi:sugar/nucleoside kinase (ribokinase family)